MYQRGMEIKDLVLNRLDNIETERTAKLQERLRTLEDLKQKILDDLEKFTSSIIHYGLWQSEEVDAEISQLFSEVKRKLWTDWMINRPLETTKTGCVVGESCDFVTRG
jgi:hypothetical protein